MKSSNDVAPCRDDGCKDLNWMNGTKFNWTSDFLTFDFANPSEKCSVYLQNNGLTEVHDAPCDMIATTMCEFDCNHPIESEQLV